MYQPELKNKCHYPSFGYAHIAFSLGSKKKVDQLTEQLSVDDYPIASMPRITGEGQWFLCFFLFSLFLLDIII